ncbi:MAG: efflux RND transporter periplasmic adaptor subunit [Alphaproteobacteria bacterium]|nr:efflux RND transporter periplasmic adaptor subunit [Alphaproteobacteria bacterium]
MKRILQIALPFVFVALGVAVFVAMRLSVGGAEKKEAAPPVASVEVVVVAPETHRAVVEASGTVEASARVDLVAQVSGRIVEVADGLTPGLEVRKGQVLARIDPRDYRANVTQAEAAVAAREVELELERARGRQARTEAQLLGAESTPSALTRREPQLALAEANLASAEATLATARLNLERTALTAPFDAVVSAENLEPGALVGPGAPVATLLGTDRYRVRVAVPVQALAWLELPDAKGHRGASAAIQQELGDGSVLRQDGYVLRRLGELDAESRTASLLVAIDDPLDVPADTLPILPGAYVRVQLQGRAVESVVRVPRSAVVDGRTVWVASPEDTLARRTIDIAWGDPDHVYAAKGLVEGDRVVVTPLPIPIEGMPLDVRDTVADATR